MSFKRLDDLRLVKEYCCKPVNETCPIHKSCYIDEFQCKYWKQIWQRHNEDFYIIRQGNSWYKDKISEYKLNKNEN